jgi:small-conductance mechanosensitive channel
MEFLNRTYLGNTLQDWLIAVGIALGGFLLLFLVKQIVRNRLLRLVKRSRSNVDDFIIPLVNQTRWFFLLALSVFLSSLILTLPADIDLWFRRVIQIIIALQVGFWGSGMISFYISQGVESRIAEDQGDDATTLDALGLISKIALWVILGLIVLDNLDVEINSLVTSLGIGGIAVALAVQNILGDLFSSLSITLDKPFAIGDFIVVGDFEGDVEDIGLKSTRVRSLSGEEVVFSNTDLLNSRIRNFKKLEKRRISFDFGVVYGTELKHLKEIPGIVEGIISPMKNVEFERVHFKTLGDYSLDYAVVYYVLVPEYATYLDIQQSINLALYEKFEKFGIEFAYPTQKLLLEQ